MSTTFEFPILTPEQQYENLVSQGLQVDISKNLAISFLTHNSYFRYMLYFKNYKVEGRFVNNVSWSTIVNDFYFDHELRKIFFGYVGYVENSFKNQFCQHSCQVLGNTWRSECKYYNTSEKFQNIVVPFLEQVENKRSSHDPITFYVKKYTNPKFPPFWNMLEVFSFGQISTIFQHFSERFVKKLVAESYNLSIPMLEDRIKNLVDARNICCHHNKLYDRKHWKIANKEGYIEWNELNIYSTFHIFTILYYFLEIVNPHNDIKKDIDALLKKYPNVQHNFPTNRNDLWT